MISIPKYSFFPSISLPLGAEGSFSAPDKITYMSNTSLLLRFSWLQRPKGIANWLLVTRYIEKATKGIHKKSKNNTPKKVVQYQNDF